MVRMQVCNLKELVHMPVCNLRELVWIRRKLVWLSEKLVWILINLVRHMFAISKPGEPWRTNQGSLDILAPRCSYILCAVGVKATALPDYTDDVRRQGGGAAIASQPPSKPNTGPRVPASPAAFALAGRARPHTDVAAAGWTKF